MKRILAFFILLLCTSMIFADDEEIVNNAIKQGNCAFLFNYINLKNADAVLLEKAKRTINIYSTEDTTAAQYRTNAMHLTVNQVPLDLSKKVFAEPEKYLADLVRFLTKDAFDNFVRIKVIHDWICYNINYDTELFFSNSNKNQDYIEVLKNKKGISSGFSALMKEMCNLAGFDCLIIDGYAKGYGYNGSLADTVEHVWNAVNINSKWYLVDTTWDTGFLERKTFIKCYSSEYLFLDSRYFLYTHLPKDNSLQFFAPVVTNSQFEKEPKLEGKFFNYGFSLLDNNLSFFNEINDEFYFELKSKTPKEYMATTLFTKNGTIIQNATWLKKQAGIITPIVDVPDTIEYIARFYMQSKRDFPFSIDVQTVEETYFPKLKEAYNSNHISQEELKIFKDAFYKVPYNNKYYFLEDPFDSQKIKIVTNF